MTYVRTKTEPVTRPIETMDQLMAALFEVGYGKRVELDVQEGDRSYRVALMLEGESTGLKL